MLRKFSIAALAAALLLPAGAVFASGYTTSIDVYLDVDADLSNDTRWEISSAINTADDGSGACTHRRDYIFTCGWYDDSDITGSGPRYVCSASNNSVGWPKNPGRMPVTLEESGWYTFRHDFHDDGLGVLAVDMEILDSGGATRASWTLTNPGDVIGDTVGGNRYGWFVVVGCTAVSGGSCTALDEGFKLPIDNTVKCTGLGCDFDQGFELDTAGWLDDGFLIERVASGTGGVDSADGGWHAEVSAVNGAYYDADTDSWYYPFTRWGGYSCDFGGGSVGIDLRPNNEQNQINTGAKQLVPIAILGGETFDPCDEFSGIDEYSVLVRGASPSTSRTRCEDVNGDGWTDMLLYFRARDLEDPTAEECADPEAMIELTGSTLEGASFKGTDHVTWLGCD